jgi:hypothetical protein
MGLRAALINPAVVAPLSLGSLHRPQTNLYTGEPSSSPPAHRCAARWNADHHAGALPGCWSRPVTRCSTTGWPWHAMPDAARRSSPGGDHSFTRFPDFVAATH